MKRFAVLCPFLLVPLYASAQAVPPAIRKVDFSLFAGITDTQTGLSDGRNGGVTAGLDVNLPDAFHLRPVLEVRANKPFNEGHVDFQKSVLGGLRVEAQLSHFERLTPYVDFLAGSGKITFVQPYGLTSGQLLYSQPASIVLSPGLGLRVALTPQIAVFGDIQLQRFSTPASLSGHLFAKPLTAGLVYRFALPQRRIRPGR